MPDTIGATVAARRRMAINHKTSDIRVRKRLLRCLPPLVDTIDRRCPCVLAFHDGGARELCGLPSAPPGFLLAAATRRGATLCACEHWPQLKPGMASLGWSEVALGASYATEQDDCAVASASVAHLLGTEVRAVQQQEAARIADTWVRCRSSWFS